MKTAKIVGLVAVVLVSCNNNDHTSGKVDDNEIVHHSYADSNNAPGHAAHTKPDFSDLRFASGIDTTCGMPLSAGVSDTLVFDGKLYGFCTPGCKAQFAERTAAKQAAE